jgi:hypothetical protein
MSASEKAQPEQTPHAIDELPSDAFAKTEVKKSTMLALCSQWS